MDSHSNFVCQFSLNMWDTKKTTTRCKLDTFRSSSLKTLESERRYKVGPLAVQ